MLFSKSEVNKIIFPLVAQQILASTSGIINSIMVSNVGESAISEYFLVMFSENIWEWVLWACGMLCSATGHFEQSFSERDT